MTGQLDAGFLFTISSISRELAQLPVASLNLMLAVPKGHPLTKLKKLRLRDLNDAAFIWFPRRESPAYYDRLMHECFRGGLKSPHIVQEAVNEATILSLVSCRLGVAFVSSATRWRCPESVALLPVTDLKLPLPFALIWRKDNVLRCLQNSWPTCGVAGSGKVYQSVKMKIALPSMAAPGAAVRIAQLEAEKTKLS